MRGATQHRQAEVPHFANGDELPQLQAHRGVTVLCQELAENLDGWRCGHLGNWVRQLHPSHAQRQQCTLACDVALLQQAQQQVQVTGGGCPCDVHVR